MGVIALLKKESESMANCEITKYSQNLVLDEECNAKLGLELILKNNSEEMDITGIRIVVPDQIERKYVVEKSKTLLDESNPWNKRYSHEYKLKDEKKGIIILDGKLCHVIGFIDHEDLYVDQTYRNTQIIHIDFKKIADQGLDNNLPAGISAAFRAIVPFKHYAFGIEETFCCKTFLYHQTEIPEGFIKYLRENKDLIIKIRREPCDLHIQLPSQMVCQFVTPMPAKVVDRSYNLFGKSKYDQKREGVTWRARHVLKETQEHVGTLIEDEILYWSGVVCFCHYSKPITREWLTRVIKEQIKKAFDDYVAESQKLIENEKRDNG